MPTAASSTIRLRSATRAVEFLGYAVTPERTTPIAPAEAVIGRPLTPMSVAGVARRTSRRCAVGVYYC
jgi:hypothetical protein